MKQLTVEDIRSRLIRVGDQYAFVLGRGELVNLRDVNHIAHNHAWLMQSVLEPKGMTTPPKVHLVFSEDLEEFKAAVGLVS